MHASNNFSDTQAARNAAQAIEKEIYNSSASKEAYTAACERVIMAHTEENPISDSAELYNDTVQEAILLPSAITIGTYEHANHYRDGLFSTIYKARITIPTGQETEATAKDGEIVALKVTTPDMMAAPHDSKREARILELARHEHVVSLIDAFQQSGGRFVLVLPFLPYDLERLLKGSKLNHKQVQSHLHDLFSALSFVHSRGIIHRDIKPSNILLQSPNGPAYLADFGIAWTHGDPASEKVDEKITDVGTASYRPPELLFGNTAYGCSLDLWAAGCVVAEAASLTDHTLFDSGDLGSELALIQSVFKTLGTPNSQTWPEAKNLRDWGKMQFYEYPPKPWIELLPHAPPTARDLVAKLLQYESGSRLSAADALKHPYFSD